MLLWLAFKLSSQKEIDKFIKKYANMLCAMIRNNTKSCDYSFDCNFYRDMYIKEIKFKNNEK